MKFHFEFYSGVTQAEISAFLEEKGVKGEWTDKELNIYKLDDSWTSEDYTRLNDLCKNGFELNGVLVRGTPMVPPPPALARCYNVL